MGTAPADQEGPLMPRTRRLPRPDDLPARYRPRSRTPRPDDLPGWDRFEPGRGGWLLPLVVGCLIFLPFAALFAYLFATDPTPGLSPRSWFTFGLAGAVGLVLVVRGYRQGQLPVWRSVTEYLAVAFLAVLLVTVPGPPPAAPDAPAIAVEQPGRGPDRSQRQDRREARPDQRAEANAGQHQDQDRAASLPPVLRQVVGAAQWLAQLWKEADRRTPGQPTTTTTTDRERPAGAAPPPIPGGMPA
jgi:hypothetical protein